MSRATHLSFRSASALRPLGGNVVRAIGSEAVSQMAQPGCDAHGHDKVNLCHAGKMGAVPAPFKPAQASRLRERFVSDDKQEFSPALRQNVCASALSGGVTC